MKKILFTLVVSLSLVGMMSCTGNRDFTGTVWNGMTEIDIDGDGQFDVECETNLKFSDADNGVVVLYFMGDSIETPFKYTCDSKGNGLITMSDEDGTVQNEFAVIGDDLTIFDADGKIKFKKVQ